MYLFVSATLAADLLVGPAQSYATLEAAIDAAITGDSVVVDGGNYSSPSIQVNAKDLTVRAAAGTGSVFISLSEGETWLRVTGNGTLVLEGLEIDGQGARRVVETNGADVTLQDCTVRNVRALADGGAVATSTGAVTIKGSLFENGVAGGNGGFLAVDNGSLTVESSHFESGNAVNGGAIYAGGLTSLVVRDSTLLGNDGTDGSGLWSSGALTVDESQFVANSASVGGTVFCESDTGCVIDRSIFERNQAAGATVAVLSGDGDHQFQRGLVCDNQGARLLALSGGTTLVRGAVFFDNSLDTDGVFVASGSNATVRNAHLVHQVSTSGAPALRLEGTGTLENSLVAWNDGSGSAVFVTGTLTAGYNLYWSNTVSDSSLPLSSTESTVDPRLAGTTTGDCDYAQLYPMLRSPLLDGGDPAYQDVDGSVSDIGAFGGEVPNSLVSEPDSDEDGIPVGEDCDDDDSAVSLPNEEIPCNGIDESCTGGVADRPDSDGDGFGLCDGDCNDEDANTYPGAAERPNDGVDQDCDGEDLGDGDGDGILIPYDCDDSDPTIYPGAEDIPFDGIDQDCTGNDATAALTGRYGYRCGCTSSPSLVGGLPLLVLLVIRRRR